MPHSLPQLRYPGFFLPILVVLGTLWDIYSWHPPSVSPKVCFGCWYVPSKTNSPLKMARPTPKHNPPGGRQRCPSPLPAHAPPPRGANCLEPGGIEMGGGHTPGPGAGSRASAGGARWATARPPAEGARQRWAPSQRPTPKGERTAFVSVRKRRLAGRGAYGTVEKPLATFNRPSVLMKSNYCANFRMKQANPAFVGCVSRGKGGCCRCWCF